MAHKWVGTGSLTRVDGDDVAPGEKFNASDAELRAFGDVIESVDDPSPTDEESEDVASESDEGEDTDYAEMDYAELRQLAVDADTDEINGRSSKDEIVAYLSGE